ncbi:MAG: acylneuraminate cytidylyltransferase family protein, partial [Candidatus Limisoma sp.]|nr:acylneuraminate cytidylyltransferase family protein [Candidatus Limisoma sp.]
MKTLYVIPARGGSKGIPHKNIKPLAGKPLIGYSIDVARQLAADDDICLTTDDPEIAATAESMGLNVPFLRPASLATDTCGTYEVLIHALDFYRDRGIDYDTLVLLQPTSPMRTADDVRAALALYSPDIDMVVTVKEAASNPYYNCYETDNDGFLHISKGDGGYTRRQDAPKVWEYNGAVYVINVESLRRMPLSAFTRRRMSVMPAERSVDLDTPVDWLI